MDQEEQQVEQVVDLGQLIVYKQVKESQNHYGLQHGDYSRYQKYCSNKVKKVRKQMKFTYGKRFHKRVIEQEITNDARVLQVLLYRAEKNWAHAMSLKQLINSGVSKKINKNQTKVYLVKKFKRAVGYARILQKVCDKGCEKRTGLECEAYASYLSGMYYFESERWEQTIEQFAKSYNIYNEILKVCDQFEAGLYQEKIEQLNQSIRYCNARARKTQTLSIEDLLVMQQQNRDPTLSAKLEEMLDEHRNAKIQSAKGSIEVEYQDQKYPIKNEKVIKLLQKIQENRSLGDIESYTALFSWFDEATKLVKLDKESASSEVEKDIHSKVNAYLNYQRQLATLERNQLQMEQHSDKLITQDGLNNLNNLQTKKALKLKLTTPQEIIKYCDNYLSILRQISEEERFSKELSLFLKLDAWEYFGKSVRLFFVACLYFSNEKYMEAYSLYRYSMDQLQVTTNKYKEAQLTSPPLIQQLMNQNQQMQLKSKLNGIKHNSEQMKSVNVDLQKLTIQEETKQQQKTLFELMDSHDEVNLDNVLSFKPAELSHLMEPIPPKPIQLDIAHTFLKYPVLEDQSKKGGFWGKINIFKKS